MLGQVIVQPISATSQDAIKKKCTSPYFPLAETDSLYLTLKPPNILAIGSSSTEVSIMQRMEYWDPKGIGMQ